ncbi:MAG: 1-acyl-sn-glycerol-3-phosphate acyltransferase [Planctomycetota bacterium]|nr:1-acyl-sn-glycerol-3-phosphate acyltransferase [Planctomycetota bacterium]
MHMESPGLIRFISRFYARVWHRVHVVGEPVPTQGPVIVVANHTAGIMDGALVYGWAPRPLRTLIKYSILRIPGLATLARLGGSIAVYRKKDNISADRNNNEAFSSVREALLGGEALLMFPEGESKSAWKLRTPLRTGTARMAFNAENAKDWKLGLRIVPVGIHYTDRDLYRSRVDIRVGKSFTIESYRELHEEDTRAAVTQLMERISESLGDLVLQSADESDEPVLQLARRCLHSRDGSHHHKLQALARGLDRERTGDPAAHAALLERTHSLSERLLEHGVDPIFGQTAQPPSERTGSPLTVLPCLLSRLFWGLPARLCTLLVSRALPKDKIVSGTILLTLPVGILWNALLVALAWTQWTPIGGIGLGLLSLIALVSSGAAADSRNAYRGRRNAYNGGLADSPRTLPITREFHLFHSELDRLARLGKDGD